MSPRRAAGALLALVLATGCSSGSSGSSGPSGPDDGTGPAGGDVRQVPGQVVVADSLAVSPDGGRVAAGCGSDLCLWDADDGELADTWPGGRRVAWSPDDLLATPGDQADGRAPVLLLDAGGAELAALPGHEADEAQDAVGTGVTAVVFSPDGSLLATAGHDGTVRLWSVPDGRPAGRLDTEGEAPDSLAFSPDGHRLAVAAADAPVEVWDVDTTRLAGTLDAGPQQAVAWSGDGLLATASDTVRLWDGAGLSPRGELPDPTPAHRLAFSPDGATLAISQPDDPAVLVWPLGGDEVRTLAGHEEAPRSLAWSPDGATLFTVSGSEGVLAWEPGGGDVRRFDLPTIGG